MSQIDILSLCIKEEEKKNEQSPKLAEEREY